MKKISLPTLIIAGILVLVLAAYAVTVEVRFNEVAVKVRLGEPKEPIDDPGLYLRWPWPIETVVKYDKRLRVMDTPETEIKAADGKNIIVGCYAIWQIADPLKFHISLPGGVSEAETQLRSRIDEVRASVIGKQEMSSFVSLDEDLVDQTFDDIEQQMLNDAAPKVSQDFGIRLVSVNIRRNTLPEKTTQSVSQSMISERERIAATYREEGKSIAETIRANAQAQADKMIAFANSRAAEIRSEGIKATTRILAEVQPEDEEFFIWLQQMEALEASLREKATIFFDSTQELFQMFAEPPAEPEPLSATTLPTGLIAEEPGQ